MELQLVGGQKLQVSDSAFAREFNEGLIHQVVVAFLAAGRAGTRGHKNRSAVRGGGAKPFRQKGTGRARAGTIRSPLWRGGGKTFAASNQDYSQKVNKKMYRAAMQCILSELVRQDRLLVVDAFSVDTPKTKSLLEKLGSMDLGDNVLIVTENADENLYLAARNLSKVNVDDVASLNPVSLVGAEKVLLTTEATKKLEELFA